MRLSGTRAYYRPSPPKMPPGLVELMEGLTKEVLKQSPTDVYGFCASHMQQLLEKRDGPSPKKSLSLEEKVAKAQEKVRQRAKIRRDEYDKALLQQQQNSNAASNDVKQGSTLQVPQLVTAQVPQSISTDLDNATVEQIIPNKPIHHKHALESSAEMEMQGSTLQVPQLVTAQVPQKVSTDLDNATVKQIIPNKPIHHEHALESSAEMDNQGSTLQVPQLVTTQVPQTVSTDLDNATVKLIIPNKPIHHEHALESSAEMEISHEVASDICKPITTVIAAEPTEEQAMKKHNDLEESKIDNVEKSNETENMATAGSNKPLAKVSSNVNSETENNQTLESFGKTASDVTSKSNAVINQLKKSADQQINPVNSKDCTKAENIAGVEKDKDPVNITPENSALKNADVNLKDLNISDSFQIETPCKTEKIEVSNDIPQIPKTSEEQIQQSNITDVQITPITDVQQSSSTGNLQTDSTHDKLNTGPSEDIKLPSIITGKPQESDNSGIQQGNNPNTIQVVNSDKDNTQIKRYENVHQLNNMPSTEVSYLKIEEAQLPKNSENNKLSNTATGIVQQSDNSDTQHGNNPNTIQKENLEQGNTQIKTDEKVPQLINTASTEVSYLKKEQEEEAQKKKEEEAQLPKNSESNKLSNTATGIVQQSDNSDTQHGNNPNTIQKDNSEQENAQIKIDEKIPQLINTASTEVSHVKIEDSQLLENSEINKPKDAEKLDNIDKFTKPETKLKAKQETKKTVVSEPESRIELPVTGVDGDIPTMVTQNSANNDDNGLTSEIVHTKEIRQHDDKHNADSEKVVSDLHTHQIAKANSSDSNTDFSIPSHSTEDDDISHDETSANMSGKAQNDNQDASTMDLETAAITIQKVFRNFLFKSRGSTFEDSANDEGNFLDEDDKNKEECEFPIASALNIDRRAHGITRMDTVLQTVNEEKSLSLSTDDSSTLSSAATIIQAHVRGFLVRNKLNSNKTISTNSLAASNSNEPSVTSLEADNDHNKNKTILNIHIVPEGENCFSRDESLITSMDLSLDSSPPSSINLHPLGYDKSERRKQLKREDAIQSVSPPSNNSGKLSEDLDSVKELSLNDHEIVEEQLDDHDINIIKDELAKENRMISPVHNGSLETDVKTNENNITNNIDDSETRLKQKRKSLTKMSSDEMDVVTPFISNDDSASSILIHSGEFHDAVLPTRVSRSDTSVVSGE